MHQRSSEGDIVLSDGLNQTIYGKSVFKPILFVVSAPSGAGKTSLCKEIAKRTDRIHYSVSYTTRSPRPGEVDSIDYYFVSRQHFLEMKESNLFIESAEVYGNLYGTSRKTIQDSFHAGKDVLVDIDIQGAELIRKDNFGSVSIYILPPSRQILEERLTKRGQDSSETLKKRLDKVRQEVHAFNLYDYLIFNVDFGQAIDDLHAIILSEHHRRNRMENFVKTDFLPRFEQENPLLTKSADNRL